MEDQKNETTGKVLISIKVTPELKEQLEALAKEEDRTLSQTGFRLLRTHPLLVDKQETAISA